MTNDSFLRIGIFGSVIAAVCCFTPVLLILLGAIGLAGLVGSLTMCCSLLSLSFWQ